jgi:hypothetical protein
VHRDTLSIEQKEHRAQMAVAEFLFRELLVPKVYLEAEWPKRGQRVDVMAIDRSGAGDLHVVEVHVGTGGSQQSWERLMQVPAHYKYIALFENRNHWPAGQLFEPHGMGRIGIIQVSEEGSELRAALRVRPERFRLTSEIFKQVDRFTASHPPHIEVRP